MSNVNIPRLDSRAIKKLARDMAPTYALYHAGPEWFVEQFNGSFYFFPPDLGGDVLVRHPATRHADGTPLMVKADGILRIRDRYGLVYGKLAVEVNHPIYGYPMGRQLPVINADGKIDEESAENVINFFTKKFGPEAEDPKMALGILLLTGDPDTDALLKAEARRMWVNAHRAWATAERVNRLEQIKDWQRENPGRTDFPPMNASQRRAEEILLAAEEDRVISGLKYVCACGSYETDSEENFLKHKKIRHPENASAAAVVNPAKKRGRPRKNPVQP